MFFKKRKKSLRIGSCDFCRYGSKFSKILVFVQKLKFHHQWQVHVVMKTTTKQGKVVSPEVVGSFCSFLRKCLPNSQVWITWVCRSFFFFFRWNWRPRKKVINLPPNSFARVFFFEKIIVFLSATEVLYVSFLLHHMEY